MLTPDAFRVALHRLLHPQRRVARAHRVVLVGERRAEERHDPVAHDLVDGALVAVDGLHHVLEHRVEQLARLLGIAVGEQLHRALEVGEEDGHLLALALEGGLGREDLLGEMFGRVGLRRGNLPRRRGSREGPTALAAELLRAGVRGATGRAHRRQPGSALPTELHGGEVVVLAPRAVHAGSPPTRDVGPVPTKGDARRPYPALCCRSRTADGGGRGWWVDRVSSAWRAWRTPREKSAGHRFRVAACGLSSTVAHAGTARLGQAVMHVDGRRAGAVTNTGIGLRRVHCNYPAICTPASGARSFRQIRPAIDPLPSLNSPPGARTARWAGELGEARGD